MSKREKTKGSTFHGREGVRTVPLRPGIGRGLQVSTTGTVSKYQFRLSPSVTDPGSQ